MCKTPEVFLASTSMTATSPQHKARQAAQGKQHALMLHFHYARKRKGRPSRHRTRDLTRTTREPAPLPHTWGWASGGGGGAVPAWHESNFEHAWCGNFMNVWEHADCRKLWLALVMSLSGNCRMCCIQHKLPNVSVREPLCVELCQWKAGFGFGTHGIAVWTWMGCQEHNFMSSLLCMKPEWIPKVASWCPPHLCQTAG